MSMFLHSLRGAACAALMCLPTAMGVIRSRLRRSSHRRALREPARG